MQRQKKIEINLTNKIKAMKQLSFLLLLMIHFSFYVNAQNTTINNMQRSALQTSDVIKQGSEVKGYYFFYISDKIDRRTNQYTLRIMDNNLNVLKDITFEDSKGVTVLEASFLLFNNNFSDCFTENG